MAVNVIGYGTIVDNDETRLKGLAGRECQILSNSALGISRVYVFDDHMDFLQQTVGGSWAGPFFVRTEHIRKRKDRK